MAHALRAQRKALGITQQELAELSGAGVAFLYHLERGKPTVRLDKLLDVMVVLGLQLTVEPGTRRLEVRGVVR